MRIVLFGEYSTALSAADCLRGFPITVAGLVNEPRLASLSRFVEDRIVLPERSVEQAVRCLESFKQKTGEKLLLFPCADIWMETLSEDLPRVLRIGPMLPAT